MFAFIDQLSIGGHYNCPVTWNVQKHVCNSVIVINLNPRVNEEVVISAINHETLHTAITHCLRSPSESKFIERVIEDWIMGENLRCDSWEGTIEVRKHKD